MNINGNKTDLQIVEVYHDKGWMPDRIYYQLNDKSAHKNYIDQLNKRRIQFSLNRKIMCFNIFS